LPSQDIDDAVSPRTALPLICSLELEGLERCLESLRDKLESAVACAVNIDVSYLLFLEGISVPQSF
jgi:hypothetical protein